MDGAKPPARAVMHGNVIVRLRRRTRVVRARRIACRQIEGYSLQLAYAPYAGIVPVRRRNATQYMLLGVGRR